MADRPKRQIAVRTKPTVAKQPARPPANTGAPKTRAQTAAAVRGGRNTVQELRTAGQATRGIASKQQSRLKPAAVRGVVGGARVGRTAFGKAAVRAGVVDKGQPGSGSGKG